MSIGGGSSGSSKTTTTSNPWGPQQPYLTDIFARAVNLANAGERNPVGTSPLYQSYINNALSYANGQFPGQTQVYNTWGQALNAAAGPGTSYASNIYNIAQDQAMGTQLGELQKAGNAYNHGIDYAQKVAGDIGTLSEDVYNTGRGLVNDTSGNVGIAKNLANQYALLNAFPSQAYGNEAIQGLANMSDSQWASPYTYGLAASGLSATENPYMHQIAQAAGGYNPYVSGTAQSSALAMLNPALSDLQKTASGTYLSPETNPYLQQAVQAAQDQSLASIASQFNKGGRYGSGMMAGTQARELGNIAATAYANQYESERQKQLAAQQALGGQYLQGVGQLTAGQQAAGQLTQGQQGLGIQGLGEAGQMYGTGAGQLLSALQAAGALQGQQQQLGQSALAESGQQYGTAVNQALAAQQAAAQAAQNQVANAQNAYNQYMQAQNLRAQQELSAGQLYGGLTEQQLARQLQGQGLVTQGMLETINQRMQGAQSAADEYLKSLGISTQAMGFAPVAQWMQADKLAQLANAAQLQQQIMQMPQQEQWGNLANYLAMVQGNYGGVGSQSTPYYQNPAGSALGGALGGAGLGFMVGGPYGAAAGGGLGLLGGLLSNRVFKDEIEKAPIEDIASRMRRLPIGVWRYRDEVIPHVGPYAEDFREAFGLGNGVTIPVVDAIGVLFATVQHLMAQNDELRSKVEDIRNAV